MDALIEALPPVTPLAERRSTAAAAILVTEDERFLLQHRDARPDIWFPDFWGLFGGAIEEGETPERALKRELDEELGLRPATMRYFTQVCFDLRPWDLDIRLRYVFEVSVTTAELRGATLREGQAMRLFTADKILRESKLTPYDSLALRLYLTSGEVAKMRERLR